MNRQEFNEKFVKAGKLATLAEVCELAVTLRPYVSDVTWATDEGRHEFFIPSLSELDFAIIFLQPFPKEGPVTLEYRLARAEAESLHLAIHYFERSIHELGLSHSPKNLTKEEEHAVLHVTAPLLCAITRLIVLAHGI
jgi:hypothetical protein